MATPRYDWPLAAEFLNRERELNRLEEWWQGSDSNPIAMIGRRRVGKSWLFRRFAHRKPAVVLVSEQIPPGMQLSRFAEELAPVLGVRPELPDVVALFRVIYRAAREERLLVVVDEFPWLLGSSEPQMRRTLSAIQAVMEEERASSKLKLVLCGSHVGQMEALFSEGNPMHGRFTRFEVRPMEFGAARPFFQGFDGIDAFVRYAIAGGMPMYLSKLASGSLRESVCRQVLDRDGPLWNEGRSILEQELREPRVYFGILEQLATGEKELNEIAQPLRMDGGALAKYLGTLVDLRVASRQVPFGAPITARSGHWRLDDAFFRFWFRFVFPFQNDLETGLRAQDLYEGEVVPALADHVSPVFEQWCREWLRSNRGQVAVQVGRWWGNALDTYRRDRSRSSEEIDAVGTLRNRVTLVSEMKWTTRKLDRNVVDDLQKYKLPALKQAGFRIADPPRIVLFSKAGYSKRLRTVADHDRSIELVDVQAELSSNANRK